MASLVLTKYCHRFDEMSLPCFQQNNILTKVYNYKLDRLAQAFVPSILEEEAGKSP